MVLRPIAKLIKPLEENMEENLCDMDQVGFLRTQKAIDTNEKTRKSDSIKIKTSDTVKKKNELVSRICKECVQEDEQPNFKRGRGEKDTIRMVIISHQKNAN